MLHLLGKQLVEALSEPDQLGVEFCRVQKTVEPNLATIVDDEIRCDGYLIPGQIWQYSVRCVGFRHRAIEIEKYRKGKIRSLRIDSRRFLCLQHIDHKYLNATVVVVLPELLEMRSLRITEWSPTGTKVKDDVFPCQIGAADDVAFERLELERRRFVSDHRLLDGTRNLWGDQRRCERN